MTADKMDGYTSVDICREYVYSWNGEEENRGMKEGKTMEGSFKHVGYGVLHDEKKRQQGKELELELSLWFTFIFDGDGTVPPAGSLRVGC